MKIIVFGATGSLGQHVVKQALEQGHQVSAFTRSKEKLEQFNNTNLTPVIGDVLNSANVEQAVKDHDAAIIALGDGMKGGVRAQGTQHIINAMKKQSVNRLICLSTLGAGDSHRYLNFFWKYIMFGLLLKNTMVDHEAQEALVRDSDLDWTIIRPAAYTDGPQTQTYQHGNELSKGLKLKISRSDVASFILKGLDKNFYLHQEPCITY